MDWLTDPFQYDFMWRALAGSALVGILCAVVGTFVVLRGIAMIGDGLAHGSLAGLALGHLAGWNLYLAAGAWSLGMAGLVGLISDRTRVKLDTAVGILFTASMSLGIVLLSSGTNQMPDLTSYLFGYVLAVSARDLLVIAVGALVVLGLVVLFFKELFFLSFDAEAAAVSGVPTRLINFLMLCLIAVTVVLALSTMGVMLASAFLIIPAATAMQVTRRLATMMGLAMAYALAGSLVGLYASWYLNWATGGAIGLTLAIFFAVTLAFSRRRVPLLRSLGYKRGVA
jgi:ABC-type Mn2+/Zn2+ transport system permease subunit